MLNKAPKVSVVSNGRRLIRFAVFIIIGLLLITAPQFIGTAFVSLVTKFFIFAILAMSLDIVFGYAGLWSFCHAAIFGVAGYTAGILAISLGITNFWLTASAGILMAGVTAAIFGVIALRVSKLYFLIVTLALGQLIYGIALQWKSVTNGYDGLWNVPFPPDIGFFNTPLHYYYFTLIVAVICTVLLYLITRSPFGHSLEGIRDNEIRMRTLGYNTWLFKYIAFIIGGLFAGVAGIVYLHYNSVMNVYDVGLAASGMIILMLIIGGAGRLWGAIFGSLVFVFLQFFVSLFTPARWPLIMGVVFILVAMFLREGIWGYLNKLFKGGGNPGSTTS